MIKSVSVINPNGEELVMELRSPEKSGFFIQSIEGLGPSKSNVNLSQSLWSDGALFNSARNESRNLVFRLGFMESPTETIEDIRLRSYRFFPNKKPITIDIVTDNRTARTVGYVETNEPDIFSKEQTTQISLICPDSYFYGKEYIETVFSGVVSGFEFPFENPSLTLPLTEFGSIFINTQANAFYDGDISTGVIILISFTGAVTNPTINNITNGQSMAFDSTKLTTLTGYNFKAGDLLIVSTIRGSKSITLVRSGLSYNVLNIMSTISDWIVIDKGDNVFEYTASSGLTNMQFLVMHQVVFEGLLTLLNR
jgi:hypothetical protein